MAKKRQLRPTEQLLGPAVAESLQQLGDDPQDVAARRLVERYAAQIDEAAVASAYAAQAAAVADDEPDLRQRLQALEKQLEERNAVEKLGPKLLQALESLGATAYGRSRMSRSGGESSGPSKLDKFRSA